MKHGGRPKSGFYPTYLFINPQEDIVNPAQSDTDLQCLVFSTNVENDLMAAQLVYILEKTNGIFSWNLDMEDHDRVLKINHYQLDLSSFKEMLSVFDIEIEELPIW